MKRRFEDAWASRRVRGEFFWVASGQSIAAMGGLVGVRLMTEVLDPVSYGELALGMTATTLAQLTVLAPLSGGILRYYNAAEEATSLREFFAACKSLLTRAWLLLSAVLAGAIGVALVLGLQRWVPLALAAFVFSLLSGGAIMLDSVQNAARQRVIVAWHDGLNQWARFLTAFALAVVIARTSTVAMLGFDVGAVIVLSSQWYFFRRRVQIEGVEPLNELTVARWRKNLMSYARPMGTWGVFYWAQVASDRWSLEVTRGTAEVGRYAVLYQLGYYPILLLSGVVVQLVSPIVFQRAGGAGDPGRLAESRRLTNLVLLATSAVSVLAVGLAVMLHRGVFRLLVSMQYRDASPLLPLVALSAGIFAAGQVVTLAIMAERGTGRLLLPRVTTALLGIAFNFVGARAFGVTGLVWAGILINLIFAVWAFGLSMRSAAERPPFS